MGVAFLAESIYLEDQPEVHPRMQPLQVAPETSLIAVVRLENTPQTPSVFSDEYRERVSRLIAETARLPQVRAVQIDFDALRTQRGFYAALLRDVHGRIPAETLLSITALASWCLADDWLAGLPIDEAVPMLFRMGIDRASIVSELEGGGDFREPLCRSSVGVSIDEPWPEPLLGRRVYVFAPRGWTPSTIAAVERRLNP